MKHDKKIMKYLLSTIIAISTLTISGVVHSAPVDHKIAVINNSGKKIVKVLASLDGESFVTFNIGKGIKPGQAMEFAPKVNQNCDWYLKAVYADRSESALAHFDLCEKDATVEVE